MVSFPIAIKCHFIDSGNEDVLLLSSATAELSNGSSGRFPVAG